MGAEEDPRESERLCWNFPLSLCLSTFPLRHVGIFFFFFFFALLLNYDWSLIALLLLAIQVRVQFPQYRPTCACHIESAIRPVRALRHVQKGLPSAKCETSKPSELILSTADHPPPSSLEDSRASCGAESIRSPGLLSFRINWVS